MAVKTTKNKTTTKKSKNSAPNSSKKQEKVKSSKGKITVRDEIIIWCVLAISIIALISNFGFGGFVGQAISSFFFGMFGILAYIVPFVIFLTSAFILSNKSNPIVVIKTFAVFLLWFCSCALAELFFNGYIYGQKITRYYLLSSQSKSGGGLIGGLLSKPMSSAFGIAGTYVCLIIMCIICIVLITERSMIEGFKKGSTKVYCNAREDADYMRQKAALRKERRRMERERLLEQERLLVKQEQEDLNHVRQKPRRERKVIGVTLNTIVGENDSFDFPISGNPHPTETEKEVSVIPEFLTNHQNFQDTIYENFQENDSIEHNASVSEKKKTNTEKKTKSSSAEQKQQIESVVKEMEEMAQDLSPVYTFPPIHLLKKSKKKSNGDSEHTLRETAMKLQQTLHDFGVEVRITNVSCGPSVTRYELTPNQGVKVSRIVNLADDIKLNLAAADIRIEAPIPGKAAVGIEVPNKNNSAVMLRELLESEDFKNHPSSLAFAVGKDIAGKVVVTDIAKMPHLLIAGATGSGKSVCINTIIMSILYKANPEDVKLIMIDPKVVELSVYNGIPHLFIPVVTDPKKASGALNWAVAEMTERYQKFADLNVRDLKGYNKKIETIEEIEEENKPSKLPQIVIIVDELADLMMVAPGEVEDAICRLAQLARAAGIHLIIATQRPSVNVITGLIKANMPSRIAFSVSSGVDSRTIIDMHGAEKLLGKGDMLFYPQGFQKPDRVQGAFVSDGEVADVVNFLSKENFHGEYNKEMEEQLTKVQNVTEISQKSDNERDVYFEEAGKYIIEKDKASIGMLQRVYKIGFNRAARIMDQLCEMGVVGPEEGTKPRKVLMSMEEFENLLEECL